MYFNWTFICLTGLNFLEMCAKYVYDSKPCLDNVLLFIFPCKFLELHTEKTIYWPPLESSCHPCSNVSVQHYAGIPRYSLSSSGIHKVRLVLFSSQYFKFQFNQFLRLNFLLNVMFEIITHSSQCACLASLFGFHENEVEDQNGFLQPSLIFRYFKFYF